MTAKEFLQQAWRINERIQSNNEEIVRLREMAEGITASIDTNRVMGGDVLTSSKVERCVLQISQLESLMVDEMEDLIRIKAEIYEAIKRVKNQNEQLVLRLRYINFRSWDEIREITGIEDPYNVHDRALKKFIVKVE